MPQTVHNLHVTVRDMNSHPPNPAMARKLMSDSVGNAQPENSRNNVITAGDYDLQLSGRYHAIFTLKWFHYRRLRLIRPHQNTIFCTN